MAKKKSNLKKATQEPMLERIAGKLGHMTGEIIVAKNNLTQMAGGAIDSVKETIHNFTANKKAAKVAAKKLVKKAVKKTAPAKKAVKAATKKVVKKATPAKKAIKKTVKKVVKKVSGKK